MNRPSADMPVRPHKDEVELDQGTFVWTCAGAPLAREKFTMVRTQSGGIFGKKRSGLKLFTKTSSPDGSLDLETTWVYDARLYPVGIEVLNRMKSNEAGQNRRAVFSFRDARAELKMGAKGHFTTLQLGFESGWLVAVEPSVMPYAVMLGRYDRSLGGGQDFTLLRSSAMDDFFSLEKIRGRLAYKRTFDASASKNERMEAHYFTVEERTLENGGGRDRAPSAPARQVHLWCDDALRLRKALIASGPGEVTATRAGDEELSAAWRPEGDLG